MATFIVGAIVAVGLYYALPVSYTHLQQLPIHVGVLESTDTPDFKMVLERLQKRQVREVLLAPLLLTSGMHVARDMAGEGEASWKARLEKAGFSVTPIFEGLGESPLFRQIYIEKARRALRTECQQDASAYRE